MLNLSVLLEDSARRHPGPRRGRARRHPADLRAGRRRRQPGRQPAGRAAASGPATRWRCRCPNLPYFPIVYYGILKAGRRRRAAQRAAQGPRGRLPPRRLATRRRTSASRAPPSCRWARRATPASSRPTAASTSSSSPPTRRPTRRSRAPRRSAQALAGQPPTFETVVHRARRHRGHPLHQRDDRPAQGRRAVARATCVLNALTCNRALRRSPTTTSVHLVTLPLFHSFGQTVQMNAGFAVGAHARAAAAVRRRTQAVALLQKENDHLLRRRADDVLGPARRAAPTTSTSSGSPRTCGSRSPAAPRSRWRSSSSSRTVRRADPRGLRALGDLAGGHLHRPGPRRRGRARSASRSGASR